MQVTSAPRTKRNVAAPRQLEKVKAAPGKIKAGVQISGVEGVDSVLTDYPLEFSSPLPQKAIAKSKPYFVLRSYGRRSPGSHAGNRKCWQLGI